MRIIPKKTKVSTELFRGVTIPDMLVAFFGVLIMFFVLLSSLPYKVWIEFGLFILFGSLLMRIDEDPLYILLLHLLRHASHERRFQKMPPKAKKESREKRKAERAKKREMKAPALARKGSEGEKAGGKDANAEETGEPKEVDLDDPMPLTPREKKLAEKAKKEAKRAKARARKAEDKFLKDKKISEEEKQPIRERRRAEAQAAYEKSKIAEQRAHRKDISKMTLISEISKKQINYNNEYFGAVIEIPAVEFRFFSPYRRQNAIDNALGSVIRSVGHKYAANIVKIERPMVLDTYIDQEYDKIEALKHSYERGVFSEEELQARIEIVYDRINELIAHNVDDKVLVPHFYLALFDSDRRQLENQIQTAMSLLVQGEMQPKRLDDKELAVFLRYTNEVDFDEREIEDYDPADYAEFAMPHALEIKLRSLVLNDVVTHNFRTVSYPLLVDDAWGARLFDMPGTKVVMKFSQMDRDKSIRAIDRSIQELNSQLEKTGVSSRVIELETHIETLSELLVMLQNNNENLLAVNLYVTAYDIAKTRENKLLVPQPPPSSLPNITSMKKDVKRTFTEQGFRLTDMASSQFEAFVATQVNGYDPFHDKALGMPGSTVAGVFPWIYANLNDAHGLSLGTSDGVPTFIDFFRRDSERVNSNMVIVGKSGGGKSYATKSILTNLAADDAKIFVLDPENEYAELAANLHGKFINVANSSHGRINPFHVITSLEDDETEDGESTNSYAAHLQFLEEFFRQILPDCEKDALEYLNSLINRVYSRRGIDQYTNLLTLKPADYPTFDDLYDCILEEFQRTQSDYLKSNLRVLMNYISKFASGGRNDNIWNGPSTLSTKENFIVFNFQTLLANRNNTVANAQMLLVLKYLDNEIIKNREYNMRYGANRKVIVVIDEAHVFIDAKYPLALDFMFQLAKRIRKYNGMQIVITQNIKDFVGSEELARKSTAIINACQYSFIFSLAPNDMTDLCALYEKAGGINESEQEQIVSAPRGQAFVVTSPTSRASLRIETPPSIEEMFSSQFYNTHYFSGEDGAQIWEETLGESRTAHAAWEEEHPNVAESQDDDLSLAGGVSFMEIEEEEESEAALPAGASSASVSFEGAAEPAEIEPSSAPSQSDSAFSPETLQRFGFEALVSEIRRTVRSELEKELGHPVEAEKPVAAAVSGAGLSADDWFSASSVPAAEQPADGWLPVPPAPMSEPAPQTVSESLDSWFDEKPVRSGADLNADDWLVESEPSATDDYLSGLLSRPIPEVTPENDFWSSFPAASAEPDAQAESKLEPETAEMPAGKAASEAAADESVSATEPEELVYEITLEQLIAMSD